jgi:N-methylhydantoinase A
MDAKFGSEKGSSPGKALKGKRLAYFPEKKAYLDCPVYDRYFLQPSAVLEGPALIEEKESTCVIGIGDNGKIDAQYNLVINIETEER